jgi:hypothetical protein
VEFCQEQGLQVPGVAHDATEQKAILRTGAIWRSLGGKLCSGEGQNSAKKKCAIESSGQTTQEVCFLKNSQRGKAKLNQPTPTKPTKRYIFIGNVNLLGV